MPFLENLILGRPGGGRRQRYTEDNSFAGGAATGDRSQESGFLSTFAGLQRRVSRTAGSERADLDAGNLRPGDGRGGSLRDNDGQGSDLRASDLREVELRATELRRTELRSGDEPVIGERRQCGNPACGRGWMSAWKRREYPVFDGHWACSRTCLAAMVRSALKREAGDGVYGETPEPYHHRVPLGLVMLAQGWITHPELQRALEAQRLHGSGRIGEWLVSECGMKPERIARGLSVQWNCPVLSTESFWPEAMALALPRVFLEEYGVLPLRLAGRKILYVGFKDCLDAAASFALEQMTGLKAESGMLPESEFSRAREILLRCEFPRETTAAVSDRDELARAIAGTVEHEQPEASRLVRLHRYYWLRVWAKGDVERAAGDLPANVNGVRDYLFTIGSRVMQDVWEERPNRSGVAAGDRAQTGVGTPVPVVVSEVKEPLAGISEAEEPGAVLGNATAGEEESVVAAELGPVGNGALDVAVTADDRPVREEGLEAGGVEGMEAAATGPESGWFEGARGEASRDSWRVAEEPVPQHFLARRDPLWFEESGEPDTAEFLVPIDDVRESSYLQRFMRRGSDAEAEPVETMDGEYLPVEPVESNSHVLSRSNALVPRTQLAGWNRLGSLMRSKRIFWDRSRDRELDAKSDSSSGPGREG